MPTHCRLTHAQRLSRAGNRPGIHDGQEDVQIGPVNLCHDISLITNMNKTSQLLPIIIRNKHIR
jgi:hypothetical protein